MVFHAEWHDPCARDVAKLSEKIITAPRQYFGPGSFIISSSTCLLHYACTLKHKKCQRSDELKKKQTILVFLVRRFLCNEPALIDRLFCLTPQEKRVSKKHSPLPVRNHCKSKSFAKNVEYS